LFYKEEKVGEKEREEELMRKLNRKLKFLEYETPQPEKINYYKSNRDNYNKKLD